MSKDTPTLDRRLVARLACEGEPSVLLAEITGLPRLELEAALKVDGELAELRRYYEQRRDGPPEERADRLRRLLVVAVERSLEQGEVRGIGWAVRGLGLLAPLPGTGEPPRRVVTDPKPTGAVREMDDILADFAEGERDEWDGMGYERWPVPPTIPWRPDAPRPRGPLEIENEAGTEAERARQPLPWPPRRPRPAVAPDETPPSGGPQPAAEGEPESREGSSPGDRWPPHLRPV
jgi:hypothetical protein